MPVPDQQSQGYIVVLEPTDEPKARLLKALHEAARSLTAHQLSVLECTREELPEVPWNAVRGVVIGPSLFHVAAAIAPLIPAFLPRQNIASLVGQTEYDLHRSSLGTLSPITLISVNDAPTLTGFLEQCQHWTDSATSPSGGPLVVGVAHIKGGVGGTTITNALGSCWARHGCPTLMYDNDPVAPLLHSWAGARGLIPNSGPFEYIRGYEPNLGFVRDQKDMSTVLTAPIADWPLILIDLGRIMPIDLASNTIANQCGHICLVFDDSRAAIDQTLLGLTRFREARAQSDNSPKPRTGIFGNDRSRSWSLVLNAYTGQTLALEEIVQQMRQLSYFPQETELFSMPYVSSAQDWASSGQSFYDCSETRVRELIRKLAVSIFPFSYETMTKKAGRIMRERKAGE